MRLAILALCTVGACVAPAQTSIRLQPFLSGFDSPTDIAHAGDGSGRLFIVEKAGIIRIARQGTRQPTPFLDIRERVDSSGSEQGLLGLAFPPDFARKGHFYVNYTDRGSGAGNTVIARYRVSGNGDVANPGSEEILLRIPQPYSNHNGGQILFGPRDGYLYIGMGDGGSGGDPQNFAQRGGEWLGKMLRIDVESGVQPYAIPPDNPTASLPAGTRPEVWATGLRNPWRFAFDRATGDLFIADVGQNRAEEVSFQPASSRGGENYGWRLMEGFQCFNPARDCAQAGLTMPILEYTRGEGVSITGGRVYRGQRENALRGMYLYADFGSGRFWGVRREGGRWVVRTLLASSGINPSTFGEDEDGEVYVADFERGNILRVTASAQPSVAPDGIVNAASNAAGITPGGLATLFLFGVLQDRTLVQDTSSPLPTTLAGLQVLVNGVPAPMLLVDGQEGPERVLVQVPWETPVGQRVSVAIQRDGQTVASADASSLPAQPGLFTGGSGQVLALREADGTLVTGTNRARAGDALTLYATGLGAAVTTPANGTVPEMLDIVAANQISVTIQGRPASLLSASLSPGRAGVWLVRVTVPEGVTAGEAEVVASVGDARSVPVLLSVE